MNEQCKILVSICTINVFIYQKMLTHNFNITVDITEAFLAPEIWAITLVVTQQIQLYTVQVSGLCISRNTTVNCEYLGVETHQILRFNLQIVRVSGAGLFAHLVSQVCSSLVKTMMQKKQFTAIRIFLCVWSTFGTRRFVRSYYEELIVFSRKLNSLKTMPLKHKILLLYLLNI